MHKNRCEFCNDNLTSKEHFCEHIPVQNPRQGNLVLQTLNITLGCLSLFESNNDDPIVPMPIGLLYSNTCWNNPNNSDACCELLRKIEVDCDNVVHMKKGDYMVNNVMEWHNCYVDILSYRDESEDG